MPETALAASFPQQISVFRVSFLRMTTNVHGASNVCATKLIARSCKVLEASLLGLRAGLNINQEFEGDLETRVTPFHIKFTHVPVTGLCPKGSGVYAWYDMVAQDAEQRSRVPRRIELDSNAEHKLDRGDQGNRAGVDGEPVSASGWSAR